MNKQSHENKKVVYLFGIALSLLMLLTMLFEWAIPRGGWLRSLNNAWSDFRVNSPIYFGVFFCATLTAGLITPPVGTLIYLGCSMSNSSLGEVVKELLPFIVAVYAALFLSVIFPDIITFLPKTVFHLYGG